MSNANTVGTVQQFHAQADEIVEAISHLLEIHAHQVEEDVDDESLTIDYAIARIEEYRRRNDGPPLTMMSIAEKNRQIGWMQAVCVLHKYASPSELAEIIYGAWTAVTERNQHPV